MLHWMAEPREKPPSGFLMKRAECFLGQGGACTPVFPLVSLNTTVGSVGALSLGLYLQLHSDCTVSSKPPAVL